MFCGFVFILTHMLSDCVKKVSYYFMTQAAVGGAVILSVDAPYSKASYQRRVGNGFLGKWSVQLYCFTALLLLIRRMRSVGSLTTTDRGVK